MSVAPHIGKSKGLARRAFMQRFALLSTAGAASSFSLGLSGIAELAAQNSDDDYKALVCVFLQGGNDHANTLIPYDRANYSKYHAIRGDVALTHESLANSVLWQPEDQVLTDNMALALSPSMPNLKARFDLGEMAPLLNVGALLAPLTKAQYESSNTSAFPRPAKLFSHNDQRSTWQAFEPEGARSGWGGRIGDIALSSNQNSMFTAINASGQGVFLNGENSSAFTVSVNGPIVMRTGAFDQTRARQAMEALLVQTGNNVLANDYAALNSRSISYGGFVSDALDGAPSITNFGSGNSIASQLSIVAKLISVRAGLGAKRQVFFVQMPGFDNHSNLTSAHQNLLSELDSALESFQQAIEGLGLAKSVTTFTASDFGRTLTTNGNGTDHGWGGHHFVIGGDVAGSRFYGRAPHISTSRDDQVGSGRLLPTTSVDQYASTLALWFGVPAGDLNWIAPNIGRFEGFDIGLMRKA